MEDNISASGLLDLLNHLHSAFVAVGIGPRGLDGAKIEARPDQASRDLGDAGMHGALDLPMDAGDLHAKRYGTHGLIECLVCGEQQPLAMSNERLVIPVNEVSAVLAILVIPLIDKRLCPTGAGRQMSTRRANVGWAGQGNAPSVRNPAQTPETS
jgi:hypothetical protein